MPVRLMCFVGLFFVLLGCDQNRSDNAQRLASPPPSFALVAKDHNQQLALLDQFWAACSVVITDRDSEGESRSQQGEGTLMLIVPDKVALRLGKLGETLFWVGCDGEQYWLFDLSKKDRRTLVTGRHAKARTSRSGDGLVNSLPTQTLPLLLGIAPIPENAPGATQWSADGSLLGATFPRPGTRERVRIWFEPDSRLVIKVEIYGPGSQPLVVSELRDHDYVLISNQGNAGPRVATIINIGIQQTDRAGGFQADLHLARMEDGKVRGSEKARITPRSFDLGELIAAFGPTERLDADAPPTPRGQETP